ncbi:hypothetical protein [Streptomyces sp. NBC_00078]|uniref:hypothetical protein n=1 Tax=unclassified Streptomyces TaxID=2593676 RepID=UPI00225A10DC|nr:hypothetical protein [Streptomyces sp. NBC_00078]MCX5420032.1 hypothetical protein [Streptomyces sp. NBC_00078]
MRTWAQRWDARCTYARRADSGSGRAFRRHVPTLLRDLGLDGDHEMLAHALLAFTSLDAADYLREELGAPTTRLQATWVDLIRRLAQPEGT